jgi:hypothetical protein
MSLQSCYVQLLKRMVRVLRDGRSDRQLDRLWSLAHAAHPSTLMRRSMRVLSREALYDEVIIIQPSCNRGTVIRVMDCGVVYEEW